MNYLNIDPMALAKQFAQSIKKEDIVATAFEYFQLDCMERSTMDHGRFNDLTRSFDSRAECDIEVLSAIISVLKECKDVGAKKRNELIHNTVSYINTHFTVDKSIKEIAGELNVSYHYISHVFREKYGETLTAFRYKKRLALAMRKLISGNEKVSSIAISCGYNSVSYFTEQFTKNVGMSPNVFREKYGDMYIHDFYNFEDILFAMKMKHLNLMDPQCKTLPLFVKMTDIYKPNATFGFLHETAIIAYHGVLYASWYNCPQLELQGYTPICGVRSYDGGQSWSELQILCEDKSKKVMYCPPVYGICDDKLYMLVNQMVAPDHMHSLDLYVLNEQTDTFERLWSKSIAFKLNTNVVQLPNGKLLLPGRTGELDAFPNTPAVLISDSGKIDDVWRMVKIAPNGDLPDENVLIHPEISVILQGDTLYMFCRNDQRRVPLVYRSKDYGETWSKAYDHDIPYVSSKIYTGKLEDGRNYLIANVDAYDRSKLAVYFTEKDSMVFTKKVVLFDKAVTDRENVTACHYPAAVESNGKMFVIATLNYEDWSTRGAVLFTIDLREI